MAKFYTKPGITPGTGAGTIASPWNIHDVCANANPKGLAAYDIVLAMTDGATPYSLTTNVFAPVANSAILPCDYAGAPTTLDVILNGAAVPSWEPVRDLKGNCLFAGIKVINSPSNGWLLNSGLSICVRCTAASCAGIGFNTGTSANGVRWYGCSVTDSANGFFARGATYPSEVVSCYTRGVPNESVSLHNGTIAGNVFLRTSASGGAIGVIYTAPNAGHVLIAHNTVWVNGCGSTLRGIYVQSVPMLSHIVDNLIVNGGVAGSTLIGIDADSPAATVRNNRTWNVPTPDTANIQASALYVAPDTATNPMLTAPLSGNAAPGVSLTTGAWISALGLEPAWIGSGALPFLSGGASGGGGGISRARLVNAGGV